MRIVIDMQGAQTESHFRGIGRYTLSFTKGLLRNKGEHEIILALNDLFADTIADIRKEFHELIPQDHIRIWSAPGPVREEQPGNEARRKRAELLREAFLASLKPDIIHLCSLFEGYEDDAVTSIKAFDRNTPVSVILHDLIPLTNPNLYLLPNAKYNRYYRNKLEHLKCADLLLANSEYTRQEGMHYLDIPGENICNIGAAVEPLFRQMSLGSQEQERLKAKFGITRPFLLYTGGHDQRKNLPRLIQAFAALPPRLNTAYQLVFAGKISASLVEEFKTLAANHGLSPEALCFTGYVTDEEIVRLYNLSYLFIFPSWHEGFGLPALEAMTCGTPLIASGCTSLPETIACEEAYFDPFDVASMTDKMVQALEDDALRRRLREHGLQQAATFSWDSTAQKALAAWEALHETVKARAVPESSQKQKPQLAYVSPLPPEQSGIADYSCELIPALARFYDIAVIVEQEEVHDAWLPDNCTVHDVAWFRAHADAFERVVYHVGNSPFHVYMLPLLQDIPGTIVLHDFFLSGLFSWLELYGHRANAWNAALYASHGYLAVQQRHQDTDAARSRYPANWSVLREARGIIVHSEFSRELFRRWYGPDLADALCVIPHMRAPAQPVEKCACRKQLGLAEDAFIVCSFGMLNPTKLNHRLLSSWLASPLARDPNCHLVFVGENHGGDYGAELLRQIETHGLQQRITITGYMPAETYQQYLGAADLAVQLRGNSRGETSGTVLDCMNHGLPLIINAHGSMAELDSQALWILPDQFEDAALEQAIETLWRNPQKRQILGERAKKIIETEHLPAVCAEQYTGAIEHFREAASLPLRHLFSALPHQAPVRPTDSEVAKLAACIARSFPRPQPQKTLYIDITATSGNDLKTGIERVVRALLLALLNNPPASYRIEPVALSNVGGHWHYRAVRRYTLELLGCPDTALADEAVEPREGDMLLGLDISGHALIEADRAGLFRTLRNRGVATYFMVHDLMSVTMPEVFPPGADQDYANWLQAICRFDGAVCVSRDVADALTLWRAANVQGTDTSEAFRIGWSHHGADIAHSAPSSSLPASAPHVLAQLRSKPSFLMVGTIEPRKGHLQTLEAFSLLWDKGVDVNLVIVGKEGWKPLPDAMRRNIPQTMRRITGHAERGRHLFWLDGISDEYLEQVYAASTCLVAASFGEGFGLPLVEAAQHNLPLFVRDIPVFHEVAGNSAFYFQADTAKDLAQQIEKWLQLRDQKALPVPTELPFLTWEQSARNLLDFLLPGQ